MNFSSLKTRISFQVKILVPVITVMVLLAAVTIWLVNRRISAQLHENAAEHLDTAAKIFQKLQASQADNLFSSIAMQSMNRVSRRSPENTGLTSRPSSIHWTNSSRRWSRMMKATVAAFTPIQDGCNQLISVSSRTQNEH